MDKKGTSLKEQLALVTPILEDMRVKKEERIKEFADIRAQIKKITAEITGCANQNNVSFIHTDDQDLSLRKLNEYQAQLRILQKDKVIHLYALLKFRHFSISTAQHNTHRQSCSCVYWIHLVS